MKFFAIICLVGFCGAAHGVLLPEGGPVLVQENHSPLLVRWEDGRVAQAILFSKEPHYLSVELRLVENYCGSAQSLEGSARFSINSRLLRWIWVTHPNPDRVGKTLEIDPYQSGTRQSFEAQLGFYDRGFVSSYPGYEYNLGADQLDFPLANIFDESTERGREWLIDSWSSEVMLTNPETGVTENAVWAGAYNLKFQAVTAASYELIDAPQIYSKSNFGNNLYFYAGDVIQWLFSSSEGFCSVALNSDLTALFDQLSRFEQQSYTLREPYLWNSLQFPMKLLENTDFQGWSFLEFYLSNGAAITVY